MTKTIKSAVISCGYHIRLIVEQATFKSIHIKQNAALGKFRPYSNTLNFIVSF